jgi:MerR-like DNA binding protein
VSEPSALPLNELAAISGVSIQTVRRWQELGLIAGDADQFAPETVERIRLIQYAERRGLTAEDVAEACRTQGDVIGEFVGLITDGTPRTGHKIDEVAQRTGLEPDAMRRLWVASGLGDQEEAFDEDLEAQR